VDVGKLCFGRDRRLPGAIRIVGREGFFSLIIQSGNSIELLHMTSSRLFRPNPFVALFT
jgi:hypothetical protein